MLFPLAVSAAVDLLLQGVLDTMLDTQRNRLITANLVLNLYNVCIATAACIFSLFGMNLLSGLEEEDHIFNITATITILGALAVGGLVYLFMKRLGLIAAGGGGDDLERGVL